MSTPTVNIERQSVSGAYEARWMSDGHLVWRVYYGYTKREALALARREARGES